MPDQVPVVDPDLKEVLLADGPLSLCQVDDLVIVTFTQIRPKGDNIPGVSHQSHEAYVVCRVALTFERLAELPALLVNMDTLSIPPTGRS